MRKFIIKAGAWVLLIWAAGGCTSEQLKQNTKAQGRTLTDLQYEMVLDNVAMFISNPDALPWHAYVAKGVVTVSDTVSPSFSYKWNPITRTLGLGASRNWQEEWTITPVLDTNALRGLQKVYQNAAKNYSWIHTNHAPQTVTGPRGHHGSTFVWVKPEDIGRLAALNMEVLTAAVPLNTVEQPKLQFKGPDPFRKFATRLGNAANNSTDLPARYLLGDLPPGTGVLLKGYSKSITTPDFQGTLEVSLNDMAKSWTLNDASNFLVSIETQHENNDANLTAAKKRLNNTPQGTDLQKVVNELLTNAFPELTNLTRTVSAPANLVQPPLHLTPGPTQTISP